MTWTVPYRTSHVFFFLGILGLDRMTKILSVASPSGYYISPYLSFELTFNRGIAGGLFNSASSLVFISLTFVIICVYVFLLRYFGSNTLSFGELAILAGGFSNLIDRMWYHGVVDFIVFSYNEWYFPAFNCADMAIVIGITIVLFQAWRKNETTP